MTSIALPFRHVGRRTQRRSALRVMAGAWRVFDARPWNVVLFLLLTVGVVGYLALVNSNATAGYELRTIENRADTLREETRRLELSALDAQSVGRISERIAGQDFVPVAQVEYLAPAGSAVAQK